MLVLQNFQALPLAPAFTKKVEAITNAVNPALSALKHAKCFALFWVLIKCTPDNQATTHSVGKQVPLMLNIPTPLLLFSTEEVTLTLSRERKTQMHMHAKDYT